MPVIIAIISDARKRKWHGHRRIVLDAKDRGCSFPNCDAPGYFTEVQHVTPWAKTDDDYPVAVPGRTR